MPFSLCMLSWGVLDKDGSRGINFGEIGGLKTCCIYTCGHLTLVVVLSSAEWKTWNMRHGGTYRSGCGVGVNTIQLIHQRATTMSKDSTEFTELTHKNYEFQAKWFLNGFWDEIQHDSEQIWNFTHKFIELDQAKKKEGSFLDEFWTHKFLEDAKETHTVIALREKLRSGGLLVNGKSVSLLEYLAFRYNKSLKQIVEAPQGGNQDEINRAQALLSEAQAALADVQTKLENEKIALAAQREQEAHVRKAEADQQAAVNELKSQEKAYSDLVSSLETKSKDTSVGLVTRNKAAAELSQVKSEDPLPLRKAKISQEAALRKVEKERKASEAATVAAEEKTKQVAQAVKETEAKLQAAEDYLTEVKRKGGVAQGAIFWMEREIAEAKKYLPKRKQ
ncbi:hypothetical protein PROFUN_06295 [Planoprotostelium fungivorum]|uniref:Calcium-regulated actin-bundling protein C-terminal domain-containing protein n=1 Tax=Planoprotostelium fungivorum TaxID=1890364 RepID=A0A2P6NEA0_9EUKA|nr:hypothetical protein PROFUN_06295 [Planoprotostelium fungivorum]